MKVTKSIVIIVLGLVIVMCWAVPEVFSQESRQEDGERGDMVRPRKPELANNEATKNMSLTSEKMLKTIAGLLALNPGCAMETRVEEWGDYECLHLTRCPSNNMVHFSKDPSRDDADIILFVHAEPFLSQGLKTNEFPQLTKPPYGPGSTSGRWYFIPEHNLFMLPIKIEQAGVDGSIIPGVVSNH